MDLLACTLKSLCLKKILARVTASKEILTRIEFFFEVVFVAFVSRRRVTLPHTAYLSITSALATSCTLISRYAYSITIRVWMIWWLSRTLILFVLRSLCLCVVQEPFLYRVLNITRQRVRIEREMCTSWHQDERAKRKARMGGSAVARGCICICIAVDEQDRALNLLES